MSMLSNFRWSIREASEQSSTAQDGGEVELGGIRVTGGPTWQIDMPDCSISLTAKPGGSISSITLPSEKIDIKSQQSSGNKNLTRANDQFGRKIILILVALFGVGFLAVVISDVWRGNLNFETYMMALGSFLSGLGIGVINKSTHF